MGIVGCEGEGTEATAVIEGPEGDMIAVDTPEQPTTDIPALFKVSQHITVSSFFLIISVHISLIFLYHELNHYCYYLITIMVILTLE